MERPSIKLQSLRVIFLNLLGLFNTWNMVDAFYEGYYLAGAMIGLLVLLIARWATESVPQVETTAARAKRLVGTIVQLNPKTVRDPSLAGCFMVITEFHTWGVVGYVQISGTDGKPGETRDYRARWDEFEACGQVKWRMKF